MEVNGSTLRTSVFMTPEPSILGPSPPLVMQSPHSDQLQAVSSSRNDKAAAIRNTTQSSNDAAVELMWRNGDTPSIRCAKCSIRQVSVGDGFLFDGARAGH